MFRPSELLAFLQAEGMGAKKGLSQNFLIDGNILEKVQALAQVTDKDYVIEIGPGPGALTQALLGRGAHVIAIEIDPDFAKLLKRLEGTLTIIQADVLTLPLKDLFPKGKKAKVVANLPYHITTPILTKLAPLHQYISSITVMVQKEVAKRFAAKKNTPEYSSFSLFLQFYSRVTYGFTVPSTCFYPKPKVDSAVVRLDLKEPPPVDTQSFFQLTRAAFQKRRKMLRASLKEFYTPALVEQSLISLQFKATARPEDLTLDDFLALFELLSSKK